MGQDSQSVILKISKSISPSGYHLHLVMEGFCDAVAFAGVPRINDEEPAGAIEWRKDHLLLCIRGNALANDVAPAGWLFTDFDSVANSVDGSMR